MAKAKNEPQEPKYEKRSKLMFGNVSDISRATKKKSAYLKVLIPDELAEKLMSDAFSSDFENLNIRGLTMTWMEKVDE